MSDTINRNDIAALSIIRKIVDRLTTEKAEYEERVRIANLQAQQIQYAMSQLNAMNSHSAQLSQSRYNGQMNALANAQNAIYQLAQQQAYNQPSLARVMDWVPYVTLQEFEALKAWADGEDVLLHLLSRE